MDYRTKIINLVCKIASEDALKRLHSFTQYIYIHCDDAVAPEDTHNSINVLVTAMLENIRTKRFTEPLSTGNVYAANTTMALIGRQSPLRLISAGGPAAEDFQNLFEAYSTTYKEHMLTHMVDMVQDAFLLGYIHGKRAERTKRRHGGAH